MANTSIFLKRTTVSGRVPKGEDIGVGELAVNLADALLYTKQANGNVISISGAGAKGDKGDIGNKGDAGDKGEAGSKGDTGDKGDKGEVGPSATLTASTYVAIGTLGTEYYSINAGADVSIPFVDYSDTQGWWDPSTKRLTPTIAGFYEVNLQVWWDPGTNTSNQYNVQIQKNGNSLSIWQDSIPSSVGVSQGGTRVIYFNGSSDYITFTAYNGDSSSRQLRSGSADSPGTFFSAHLIAYGQDGAKGEKGADGIAGDKGDKGDAGSKGDTGDKGDVGDKGDTGINGDKGDKGDTGSQGDKGIDGLAGDKGDKGDTGATGDKGDKGNTGLQGDKGETGAKGEKGETGTKGEAGVKGDLGTTGDKGQKGEEGSLSSYTYANSNITASPYDVIIADTQNGSFTVTLPSSPVQGDWVKITDGYNWDTNPLTVARNGSTIEGSADDLVMDIGNIISEFTFTGNTWVVFTTAGTKGDKGETGIASLTYLNRTYTANGACTQFTVTSGMTNTSVLVTENGVMQEPEVDYTVANTTLTFTTAPDNGVKVMIRELPV